MAAKKLNAVGVEPTELGAALLFERLGDRFECRIDTIGLPTLIRLLIRSLATHGATYLTTATAVAFAEKPERGGQPPALMLQTEDGPITFDLSWREVTALSQLAQETLRHQPDSRAAN